MLLFSEGQTVSLESDHPSNSPKTGDETSAATAALPVGVSLAAILAVLVKKFK